MFQIHCSMLSRCQSVHRKCCACFRHLPQWEQNVINWILQSCVTNTLPTSVNGQQQNWQVWVKNIKANYKRPNIAVWHIFMIWYCYCCYYQYYSIFDFTCAAALQVLPIDLCMLHGLLTKKKTKNHWKPKPVSTLSSATVSRERIFSSKRKRCAVVQTSRWTATYYVGTGPIV